MTAYKATYSENFGQNIRHKFSKKIWEISIKKLENCWDKEEGALLKPLTLLARYLEKICIFVYLPKGDKCVNDTSY